MPSQGRLGTDSGITGEGALNGITQPQAGTSLYVDRAADRPKYRAVGYRIRAVTHGLATRAGSIACLTPEKGEKCVTSGSSTPSRHQKAPGAVSAIVEFVPIPNQES